VFQIARVNRSEYDPAAGEAMLYPLRGTYLSSKPSVTPVLVSMYDTCVHLSIKVLHLPLFSRPVMTRVRSSEQECGVAALPVAAAASPTGR
jgi:hypothetical protein